jgi:hypothetical protein
MIRLLLIAILFSGCVTADKPIHDRDFHNELSKWFSAWELVSKDIYHLDSLAPVEFVFFDSQFVYSNSNITVPHGDLINGPALLGHQIVWKRAVHHDTITMPDKSRVPIGLMSFAAELPGEKGKSFFVMPLPSFWQKAGVSSKELGDENLYTGVFLHEFSHSQQMQNFGKGITNLEKTHDFGIEFSDDIVQHLFGKDSSYIPMFNNELNIFYSAATEKDSSLMRAGLDTLQLRHKKFFTSKYESLKEIDEFFLTMEGLGQYTMYAWLTHKNGANIPAQTAITGVRRGKKWWSQEEGFALFLILEQLSPPGSWAKQMFGSQTESVVNLIQSNLYQR